MSIDKKDSRLWLSLLFYENHIPVIKNLFYYYNDTKKLVRYSLKDVFVKRKCEQKGPKKVSTFSTRFHVVSNVFPKYQMLTF